MARILLIDDDESLRAMLRLTLAHAGHTVIEARNGKEGLKLFPEAHADLVITDRVSYVQADICRTALLVEIEASLFGVTTLHR